MNWCVGGRGRNSEAISTKNGVREALRSSSPVARPSRRRAILRHFCAFPFPRARRRGTGERVGQRLTWWIVEPEFSFGSKLLRSVAGRTATSAPAPSPPRCVTHTSYYAFNGRLLCRTVSNSPNRKIVGICFSQLKLFHRRSVQRTRRERGSNQPNKNATNGLPK